MVIGMDNFKEYFKDYAKSYILIGGSACYTHFENAGLDFRATKDLDIVLCVEALTNEFADKFCEYIRIGEYEVGRHQCDGKKVFFRFRNPKKMNVPHMLELFSCRDDFAIDRYPTAAPLSVEEAEVSLSALLLNNDYYRFIMENKTIINDVPVASDICLIMLKIRAWLDLSQKREMGESIQSGNIKKHKADVFSLVELLPARQNINVPQIVRDDLREFKERIQGKEVTVNGEEIDVEDYLNKIEQQFSEL